MKPVKKKKTNKTATKKTSPKPVLTCLRSYYKKFSLIEMDTVPLIERSLCLKKVGDRVVAKGTTGNIAVGH